VDSYTVRSGDDSSAPEASNVLGKARPSRKLKRSKVKLATIGVAAAVAAGCFVAVEVSSAHAAETELRNGRVEVNTVDTGDPLVDRDIMEIDAIDKLCGGPGGVAVTPVQDVIFESSADNPGKTFVTIEAECPVS
jgi:hypothetical protein